MNLFIFELTLRLIHRPFQDMKKISLLALFCCFHVISFSQETDSQLVKNTIDQFFQGMKKNDSTISKATLMPNLVLRSVMKTKTGEVQVSDTSGSQFLKAIGTPHKEYYDERLLSYDIKIDGSLAMAWTPYEFYVDEKFSHCGVDIFLLIKQANGWKISSITDTRRKADCGK